MRALLPAAFLALALIGAGAARAEPLKVGAATQKRLGIVTAPLVAARRGASINGFARALDAVPLATLDADIAAMPVPHSKARRRRSNSSLAASPRAWAWAL